MPLDPRLQPVIDASKDAPPLPDALPIAERRAFAHRSLEQSFTALGGPCPDVASKEDVTVPVDGGAITVRLYRPEGDGPFPAHLYLHGGGFWIGELDHFDAPCQWLVNLAGCVVASVDYRLAPEAQFPVPVEDCYAALRWLHATAGELGVDPDRISVGGGSAGGNLSAAVALMARDRGGPPLVFQVLEIPVVDLTMSHPSVIENGEGYILTRSAMEQYTGYYLGAADPRHPYASPIFAEDLSRLPPALVMTAEMDPLRDEGEAYARALGAAGVPTTLRRWDGQFHGSQSMDLLIPDDAQQYREMVAAALRTAYGT